MAEVNVLSIYYSFVYNLIIAKVIARPDILYAVYCLSPILDMLVVFVLNIQGTLNNRYD